MQEPSTRCHQYMLFFACSYYAVQVCIAIKTERPLHALQYVLSVALILERLLNAPSQLFMTCLRFTVFAVPDTFAGAARLFRHRLRPLQVCLGPYLPILVTWREIPHLGAEMPRSGSIEWVTISFGGLSLSVLWTALTFYSLFTLRVVGGVLLLWISLTTTTSQNAYLLLLDPCFVLTLGLHFVSAVFCWQVMQALHCRVGETTRLEQQTPTKVLPE
ncbi:conserved hypothetical protein [Neospora caninum Liverpool]|uniref:Uncharacterized protein n=1 Tax=Neospora caninum (strain Liverpool) TaxID=572307 RepID=F0VB35_NEOCL|nr:conserved hypothetical protein [Neospora caninum Liverpool]CBZ50857.1 conserved hypothetical protein [Neospora caninum Liverpool]CEL68159.1 TPA: hypothetical protein BN1204_039320 [Neospora caninum Liverpool]|eukprot:XP_003880890.1 conserved hypothetical protein [Neospora caninum Liverpool]